jgi:hypothetical protein
VSQAPAADGRTTVVVITHNRRAEVTRSLERMLDLPERPRIVVVDLDCPGAAVVFADRG